MAREMRKEIVELKGKVLDMAELATGMLDDAIDALTNNNLELAKSVEDKKHKLRDYDDEIEAGALKTLGLFQPMAIDLRRLGAILKIITYLYRIGRYGKDIAGVVEELQGKYPISEMLGIKHMWEHVEPMIRDAIDAFDKSEIEKLSDFVERDDEVDKMRWSIFRESVSYMIEDPKNINISAHIIMIARYLERCGDHACKIAEKVHYMVTGKHIEIS
ncbi:MAG: phosphate signaling complex protein PhoU [Candidatus Lokiarchaeota archaeon]|nr:phosphate signaling complex protein PhoU [Candidatus Lokiarchaeota archaeon]